MTKYLMLIVAAALIVSCKSNTIYFDLDKKEITSCNDAVLSRVMVEGQDGTESFMFKLKPGHRGKTYMNIENPDTIFTITDMPFGEMKNHGFTLKPSSEYKISNLSNGDAADSSLLILTDKNSKIIHADIVDCN